MNLAEELDRAIGNGPTNRPLTQRLAAGRRALRRRAAAQVLAAVCVLAVGGVILSTTMDGITTSGDIASEAAQSSDLYETIPPQDRRTEPKLSRQAPIGLDLAGNLVVLEGVLVTRTIQNPMNLTPPGYSMGVMFQFEQATFWRLLHVDATSEGAVFAEGLPRDQTFDEWVSGASEWALKNRGSVGG